MELVLENDGRHVILLTPALHEGGEGGIYGILGTSQVAKLFHAPSAEAARKLAVMVKNVPEIGNCDGRFSLAWPLSRLMQPGGKCVGYLMTRVEGKVPLYHFSNPRLRPEWVSRGFLIRVASNLAAAVSAVHRAGHVIGDLNDSNVLVGTDASVTI